jgi:hypothetical protein
VQLLILAIDEVMNGGVAIQPLMPAHRSSTVVPSVELARVQGKWGYVAQNLVQSSLKQRGDRGDPHHGLIELGTVLETARDDRVASSRFSDGEGLLRWPACVGKVQNSVIGVSQSSLRAWQGSRHSGLAWRRRGAHLKLATGKSDWEVTGGVYL